MRRERGAVRPYTCAACMQAVALMMESVGEREWLRVQRNRSPEGIESHLRTLNRYTSMLRHLLNHSIKEPSPQPQPLTNLPYLGGPGQQQSPHPPPPQRMQQAQPLQQPLAPQAPTSRASSPAATGSLGSSAGNSSSCTGAGGSAEHAARLHESVWLAISACRLLRVLPALSLIDTPSRWVHARLLQDLVSPRIRVPPPVCICQPASLSTACACLPDTPLPANLITHGPCHHLITHGLC